MTVKELYEMLNPHFNDCYVHYLYLDEELTPENCEEYADELVQDFFIEPVNHFEIVVDII